MTPAMPASTPGEKGQSAWPRPFLTLPGQTWEVFSLAREILGLSSLQRSFGNRSTSQIGRWCRNPAYTADSERNPLDQLQLMFRLLTDQGARDIVVAALTLLADPVGLRVAGVEPGADDPGELPAGALDLQGTLAMMVQVARDGEHPAVIVQAGQRLRDRIAAFESSYRLAAQAGTVRFRRRK